MKRVFSIAAIAILAVTTRPAWAANAAFQNFFFDVCTNPTGTLATRCSETAGGAGDLSGDSESSLNPSQSLSNNETPLSRARTRGKQARERGERLRDETSASDAGSEAISVGPFSLMVHGRGSWFERERAVDVEAERGFDGETWAAELGLDYRVSNRAVIGGIVAFERTDSEFIGENAGVNFTPASNAGDVTGDSLSLTLFGSFNLGDSGFFEGSVGFANSEYIFTRNSVFQESGRAVPQTNVATRADADGDQFWLSFNFGYSFQRDAASFGPYAGATYARSSVDGYVEEDLSGSGLNMAFDESERDSLIGHLGFRYSIALGGTRAVVLPQLRIEYEHEFDMDAENVMAGYLLDGSNNRFALFGDEPDRDHFNAGASLVAIFPNGWIPFADVEFLLGDDTLDRYRISAGFRVEF